MAEMVGRLKESEGYWTPPVESASSQPVRRPVELCGKCGTEFIIGSRFCYVCGHERGGAGVRRSRTEWLKYLRLSSLSARFGLAPVPLIAFGVGAVCVLCALAIGVIYSPTTNLEWQAIQVWRIEWLMAATAMFLAAILLKRTA